MGERFAGIVTRKPARAAALLVAVGAVCALVLVAPRADAILTCDKTWDGGPSGGSGFWFDNTMWDNNLLPTSTDHVCLPNLPGGPYTVRATPFLAGPPTSARSTPVADTLKVESQVTLTVEGGKEYDANTAGLNTCCFTGKLDILNISSDPAPFQNSGTVNVTDTGVGSSTSSGITVNNGELQNDGALNFLDNGGAADRTLTGNLNNTASGSVTIGDGDASDNDFRVDFDRGTASSATYKTSGNFTINGESSLLVLESTNGLGNSETFQLAGGNLNIVGPTPSGIGQMQVQRNGTDLATFHATGGSINTSAGALPPFVYAGRLNFSGGGAVNGAVDIGSAATLAGDVPTGFTVHLRGSRAFRGISGQGGGTTTAAASFTNNGTIEFDIVSDASSRLDITDGVAATTETLTNNGVVRFKRSSGAVATVQTFCGNLVNSPTGDIEMSSTATTDDVNFLRCTTGAEVENSATFTNNGDFTVGDGIEFRAGTNTADITKSTRFEQAGGTLAIQGTGAMHVEKISVEPVIFGVSGGIISNTGGALPPMAYSSRLDFGPASTVSGEVDMGGGGTVAGNVPAGFKVHLRGSRTFRGISGIGGGTTTAASSFTNNGTIEFDVVGGASSRLDVTDGVSATTETLTNNGVLRFKHTSGADVTQTFCGNLVNSATGDVEMSSSPSNDDVNFLRCTNGAEVENSATFTNNGDFTVGAGIELQVGTNTADGTKFTKFVQSGGTLVTDGTGAMVVHRISTEPVSLEVTGGAITASSGALPPLLYGGTLDFSGAGAPTGELEIGGSSNLVGNVPSGITLRLRDTRSFRGIGGWNGGPVTAASGFTNNGTIEFLDTAAGGTSTLNIGDGVAGGGETLTNNGTVRFKQTTGSTGDLVLRGNVTNAAAGMIEVDDESARFEKTTGETSSTLVNNGTVHAGAGGDKLSATGANVFVTQGANGTFDIDAGGEVAILSSATLTNLSAGGTLTGGVYDVDGTLRVQRTILVNDASIMLGAAGQILDPNNNALVTLEQNSGLLDLERDLTLTGAPTTDFTNTGTVHLGAGVDFLTNGNYIQTGGLTDVAESDSVLDATGGSVQINGGVLQGKGTVKPSLMVNGGGIVKPGDSADPLNVDGDVTIGPNGVVQIQIRSTGHDKLVSNGAITLGGTLALSTQVGFTPADGQMFEIVDAGTTRTGTFASVTGSSINPSLEYGSPSYDADGAAIQVRKKDTDGDGVPDDTDACPNQAGGGANGCPAPADTDGDGVPDAQDACPNQPANTANGCPAAPADSDGDGVPDAQDACPSQAASTANGCPAAPADSDGDGVPDSSDGCPNEAASTTDGCPAPAPDPAKVCKSAKPTITGSGKDDGITGTEGDDVIFTGNGNDSVNGLGGNDIICTGPGNDKVSGGGGNDAINTATGNDKAHGDDGNDRIFAHSGNDKIFGDDGDDALIGAIGKDTCNGGDGTDTQKACEKKPGVP